MRMGNPSVRRWVAKSQRNELGTETESVTYKGVYGKSALLTFLTILFAIVTEFVMLWAIGNGYVGEALVAVGIATAVCAVPLIVIAIVIAFVPSAAKVLSVIYAILQGCLLGILALFVDIFYPGIAFAAFLGTAIVFLISLAVNRLLGVKISSKFMRGLMIAFFSLIVLELIVWLISLTGAFGDFSALWWIQLAVSAVCIIWATITLAWDMQSVDYLVNAGADKKYEWCVAFSLVTTLIYLYVEILELLMRLVMLFGNKKG
ncbi:MAG: Bax inhibitor-1/YccA family protein [Corallococcus sp.]|nr:Bax inhibitor-1/YccA family protein [Bacillota bacterium]MCM1533155.1 Bax inhibitor-1/YccA family protein [Corallococcus sp.]